MTHDTVIDQKPQHDQIQEPLFTFPLLLELCQSHDFRHSLLPVSRPLSGHNVLNRQFQQMGQGLQYADIRKTFSRLP